MSFWDQFNNEEKRIIDKFQGRVEHLDDALFKNEETRPSLYEIAEDASINLRSYPKDGAVLQALWVYYLMKIKRNVPLEMLKFPTLQHFLSTYKDVFPSLHDSEIKVLWHTANWMAELFKIIKADKNKGLAMMIIPKLVEGWEAKYITGSGQKEVTKHRVRIYEIEGNTRPCSRGKITTKAKHSHKPLMRAERKSRDYKKRHIRKTSPKKRPRSNSADYGMTDDEHVSVSTTEEGPDLLHHHDIIENTSLLPPPPPPLTRQLSDGDPDFREAISIFRDLSYPLLLNRANSSSTILSYLNPNQQYGSGSNTCLNNVHPQVTASQDEYGSKNDFNWFDIENNHIVS